MATRVSRRRAVLLGSLLVAMQAPLLAQAEVLPAKLTPLQQAHGGGKEPSARKVQEKPGDTEAAAAAALNGSAPGSVEAGTGAGGSVTGATSGAEASGNSSGRSTPAPARTLPVRGTAPSRILPEIQEDVYILGAGDGLQLRFLGAAELSGPVEILNDGTASLPLLGPVRLSGLSLAQATGWLESLYKRQLLRPELQLSLTKPRPLRVSVVGQVARPGLYTLSTSETSKTEAQVSITGLPTLVDALQKAGGVTAYADLRNVTLARRLPGEPLRYKRTRVNLLSLVQEGDQLQNPLLFDGDVIRLELATEPVLETMEIAETTLAPESINVNVVGEVKRPGTVTVPSSTPLIQAIMAAGGIENWRANRGNIELVRINRNGTATRRSYPLNLSQGASNKLNPPLRNGDTVIVNRSGLALVSDAITAVATPLTGLVNIWSLYRLVNNSGN